MNAELERQLKLAMGYSILPAPKCANCDFVHEGTNPARVRPRPPRSPRSGMSYACSLNRVGLMPVLEDARCDHHKPRAATPN